MGWSEETRDQDHLSLMSEYENMEFSMVVQQERERYEAALYVIAFKSNPVWLNSVDKLTEVSLKMVESELLSKEEGDSFDSFSLEEYRTAVKNGSWKHNLESMKIREETKDDYSIPSCSTSPFRKSVVDEVEELSANPLLCHIISSIDRNLASSSLSSSSSGESVENDDVSWKQRLEWVESVPIIEAEKENLLVDEESYPPLCTATAAATLSCDKIILPTTCCPSDDDVWKYHAEEIVEVETNTTDVTEVNEVSENSSSSFSAIVEVVESIVENDTIDLESYPPLSSSLSSSVSGGGGGGLVDGGNVETSNTVTVGTTDNNNSWKNVRNVIVNSQCESSSVAPLAVTVPEKVNEVENFPVLVPSSSKTCIDCAVHASITNSDAEKTGIIVPTCASSVLNPPSLSVSAEFKKCVKSEGNKVQKKKALAASKEHHSKEAGDEDNYIEKKASGCVYSNSHLRCLVLPSDDSTSFGGLELWKTLVINESSVWRWNPDFIGDMVADTRDTYVPQ